jgi:HEAT repeat protein
MRARRWVVLCLCLSACCGCGKQKTTAELLNDLKGIEERDRLIAVRLLPQRKGDAAQVIPALIEALKNKDAVDIRISAAIGLGYFGELAKDAIPALQAALRDRDTRVRDAAAHAIARIDPSAAPKPPAKR